MEKQEEKAKFFAQYIGQPITFGLGTVKYEYEGYTQGDTGFLAGILGNQIVIGYIAEEKRDTYHQSILLLKPLSSITDEDAIEVTLLLPWFNKTGNERVYKNTYGNKVVSSDDGDFKYGKFEIKIDSLTPRQYQYLQSKGYALPYMNYSVEELVEMGWVKLV